jgi:hypothetical protein
MPAARYQAASSALVSHQTTASALSWSEDTGVGPKKPLATTGESAASVARVLLLGSVGKKDAWGICTLAGGNVCSVLLHSQNG